MKKAIQLMQRILTTTAIVAMTTFGLVFVMCTAGLTAAGAITLSYTKSQLEIEPHRFEKPPGREIQERYDRYVPNTLTLRVGHADWTHMRNALRTDIENHGGKITGINKLLGLIATSTRALVSEEYARYLIDNSHQPGSYLTANYVDWGQRVQADRTMPELTGQPEVEVWIRTIPMPSGNPPMQRAMTIMALIWLLSITLILVELLLICLATTATAIRMDNNLKENT